MTVVNNFLRGELTTRFALKALTIFFISGSALYYYLSQLREKSVKWLDMFSWIISAIVVLAVVWGFVIIGSPFAQREKRFDERRVQDLQVIQSQVVNYWQRKVFLPRALSDLEDTISGFTVPRDPETGDEYEYIVTREKEIEFQLCAIFRGADMNSAGSDSVTKPVFVRGEYNENWQHETGRFCFTRTIDPDLYPPLNKQHD